MCRLFLWIRNGPQVGGVGLVGNPRWSFHLSGPLVPYVTVGGLYSAVLRPSARDHDRPRWQLWTPRVTDRQPLSLSQAVLWAVGMGGPDSK